MLILRFDGLYRGLSAGNEPDGHPASRNGNSQPGEKDQPPRRRTKAGLLCYGWLITRKGVILAKGHGAFARSKNASSNVAEYLALIEGLDALLDLGIEDEAVEVRGDAKSIIDQMRGSAEVNAASIRPYYRQAIRLAGQLRRVDWVWMPRKNNREADTLSRRAMRQLRRDHNYYQNAVQTATGGLKRRESTAPVLDLRVYFPGKA